MTMRSLRLFGFACAVALTSTLAASHAQTTSTGSSGSTGTTSGGSTGGGGTGTAVGQGASGVASSGTGGSSPFAGSVTTGFGTQSTAGQTTVSGTGTNTIPSASNTFRGTYINPYSVGASSAAGAAGAKTPAKAFGQAVYSTATTTTAKGQSASSTLNVTSNSGQGFTTLQLPKSISYSTVLSEDVPLVAHAPIAMQRRLSDVLGRSSALPNRGQMRVDVEGNVVVLSGTAATDRERQLAERVIRLEPGVFDVRNQIQLTGLPNPALPPSGIPTQP